MICASTRSVRVRLISASRSSFSVSTFTRRSSRSTPSRPAHHRGHRRRPLDRDLRTSSRVSPLGRPARCNATTTDGRVAPKPVNVIFARPALPSALAHDRDDAARIVEARAARVAADHVEEMERVEVDLLVHRFQRRDLLLVDAELVIRLAQREVDGQFAEERRVLRARLALRSAMT